MNLERIERIIAKEKDEDIKFILSNYVNAERLKEFLCGLEGDNNV